LNSTEIEELILQAVENLNRARKPAARLAVSPTALLFGPGSPLDSLGLVSLLIDIEEALADRGHPITLSDALAMSQTRSPFRDVPALSAYIRAHLSSAP